MAMYSSCARVRGLSRGKLEEPRLAPRRDATRDGKGAHQLLLLLLLVLFAPSQRYHRMPPAKGVTNVRS